MRDCFCPLANPHPPWGSLQALCLSIASRYPHRASLDLISISNLLSLPAGDSFTGYWSEGVISGPGMLALHEESPWNLPDL